MKTIGLIGGMSWESTVTYYQLINEAVHKRLADCIRPKLCFGVWSLMKSRSANLAAIGLKALRFCQKPPKV